LGQLADEGKLPKATASRISKLGKGALKTLSFLRGLPLIGQALAINDMIALIMSPGSPASKVDDLAGLVGGIGGTSLGALLGAIALSFVPGIGSAIGGGIGALIGYFGGKVIAQGLAQYMLGMQVDAFPQFPFLPNFNDILNDKAAQQKETKERKKFQATLPKTGTFGVTGEQFGTFKTKQAKVQAAKLKQFGSLVAGREFDRSSPFFESSIAQKRRVKTARMLEKRGMLDQFMDKFNFEDLPKSVQARVSEQRINDFMGDMGGNLNVYHDGGDTFNSLTRHVAPRYLIDQDTALNKSILSLDF
jgi:hypothetical protein